MHARMTDHEWMQHMQQRLRGLHVFIVVAMVAAAVAWVVS